MGLFDIFSKEKREQRALAGNIQRTLHKYLQSADRYRAMEALASDGSDEALYGLLRRFGMMYDKTIEDEQEKEWVFDTLVSKGESALPAVKRYLLAADSVSWPLRLLQKIAPNKEAELEVVAQVLADHEPGYERDPTKKIQLIRHIGAMTHARAVALITPYLKDMDEGVRFAVVESLLLHKEQEAARQELMAHLFSAAEESLRLHLRIVEGLGEATLPKLDGYLDSADAVSKSQLIRQIGVSMKGVDAASTFVVRRLADDDEAVAFACIEALLMLKNEGVARDKLTDHFLTDRFDDEARLRQRKRIAEGFAELEWRVGPSYRKRIDKRLPAGFELKPDGRIGKKKPA
jgi:hypothetical protein